MGTSTRNTTGHHTRHDRCIQVYSRKLGVEETWGTAAVLVCAGVSGGGVEEGLKAEEGEEEEEVSAGVEVGVVVEAKKLLAAALEVAVAVAPVAVPRDSFSQAEIPSADCTARLASHRIPLLRGVWQ